MIRIELEDTVASGNYTANAYNEGEPHVIATASHGTRLTALANCLTALSTHVLGNLTLQPFMVVQPRLANTI
jgi:hypothetical protein